MVPAVQVNVPPPLVKGENAKKMLLLKVQDDSFLVKEQTEKQ